MTLEELENKLNKEYKNIGTIKINEIHEDVLDIKDIAYVSSIMQVINPLDIDTPIVVAKSWRDNFTLIDGYHRLKNKIKNGETQIKVVILDDYKLSRKNDTFLEFIKSLVGQKIKFIDDEIVVVEGAYYEIRPNEGCGGCSSGWSSLDIKKEAVNKEMVVKTVDSKEQYEDVYDLYINGEIIAIVDSGYGNGYYGGDFEVFIRN